MPPKHPAHDIWRSGLVPPEESPTANKPNGGVTARWEDYLTERRPRSADTRTELGLRTTLAYTLHYLTTH